MKNVDKKLKKIIDQNEELLLKTKLNLDNKNPQFQNIDEIHSELEENFLNKF